MKQFVVDSFTEDKYIRPEDVLDAGLCIQPLQRRKESSRCMDALEKDLCVCCELNASSVSNVSATYNCNGVLKH